MLTIKLDLSSNLHIIPCHKRDVGFDATSHIQISQRPRVLQREKTCRVWIGDQFDVRDPELLGNRSNGIVVPTLCDDDICRQVDEFELGFTL